MASVDLSRKLKDCGEMTLGELMGVINPAMEWFADLTGVGWVVPAVGGGTQRIYLLSEPIDRSSLRTEDGGSDLQCSRAVETGEVRGGQGSHGESVDGRIA